MRTPGSHDHLVKLGFGSKTAHVDLSGVTLAGVSSVTGITRPLARSPAHLSSAAGDPNERALLVHTLGENLVFHSDWTVHLRPDHNLATYPTKAATNGASCCSVRVIASTGRAGSLTYPSSALSSMAANRGLEIRGVGPQRGTGLGEDNLRASFRSTQACRRRALSGGRALACCPWAR